MKMFIMVEGDADNSSYRLTRKPKRTSCVHRFTISGVKLDLKYWLTKVFEPSKYVDQIYL